MSDNVKIEKMLTEVKGIIEKHKKVDEMTGKNFNVFKVCEIDEKEVLICRFIYQLINPNGLHNQGDVFLRKFITDVLGGVISDSDGKDDSERLVITENELLNVRVYKEFVIKNNRRIDLFIDTNEHTIPIEVKIFAGDQENQCNDYLEYTKKSTLYYLTLFGDPPSDYSYNYNNIMENSESFEDELDKKIEDIKDEISCISFRDHIVPWIEDCIKDINIIDKKQIVDNLMQFLNAVRGLCNMGDNELNIELKDLLSKQKNFEAYLEMKNCEDEVKEEVLLKIVEGIRKELVEVMKEKLWGYRFDEDYNSYESHINDFCKSHKLTYPGVGIVCGKKYNDLETCVAFEVDNIGPYCGIYLKDKNRRELNVNKEINNKLDIGGNYNQTWVYKMNSLGCPNFYKPNSEFAILVDEGKRGEFIGAVVGEMVRLCNLINEKL